MKDFDSEYYLLFTRQAPDMLYVSQTEETLARDCGRTRLTEGGAPVVFEHLFRERYKRTGEKAVLSDILVDSFGLLVVDEFKQRVESFPIRGLQIYPAIYIHDDGVWHENYWYLGCYEKLDCWDRKRSVWQAEEEDDDATVERFSLDASVLQSIPEDNRLLFRMGGVDFCYLFAHERFVEVIRAGGFGGVTAIRVKDYRAGDQYRP